MLALCCEIVYSDWQRKESSPHITRAIRGAGFRFPVQQHPLFRRLEDAGKLYRPTSSSLPELEPHARKRFQGRGHREKLKDDMPLYEIARRYGRLVITNDPNLLRRRSVWLRELGVETITPAQALEDSAKGQDA